MKIYNQGKINPLNRTIYIDVDDVLLLTNQTIVKLINPSHPLAYSKDWSYKSVDRSITQSQINALFESPSFWSQVQPNTSLITQITSPDIFPLYNWVILTTGTPTNLQQKFDYIFSIPFFATHKSDISFYGLSPEESKSSIHMYTGIQIDDLYSNLVSSDASLKILYKNEVDTYYNDITLHADNLDNLYVISNPEELFQILQFATLEFDHYEFDFLDEDFGLIEDF